MIILLLCLFILIIFLVVGFYFLGIFIFPTEFGKFGLEVESPCSVSECGVEGTALLYKRCYPNLATNQGCLDKSGNQVFGIVVSQEKTCQVPCS